jgi:hypothetical protein
VWEIHDGSEVVTVIDRKWIVSIIENPYWHGELPFQIYRPIEVEHQFVGVSVIDPIEDLQRELDWLRTDRRWNAMLKLHQTYAYNDGVVDPAQIKIGPGRLIPVNGDPRDLLVPLRSGTSRTRAIRRRRRCAPTSSARPASTTRWRATTAARRMTATGVQLVQAAAGVRIQAYTRRMELELIKPQAVAVAGAEPAAVGGEPRGAGAGDAAAGEPERRWAWREIGPAELAGEFDVEPEGGATAPDNVPQDRQDAQMLMQLYGGQLPGSTSTSSLMLVAEEARGVGAGDAACAGADGAAGDAGHPQAGAGAGGDGSGGCAGADRERAALRRSTRASSRRSRAARGPAENSGGWPGSAARAGRGVGRRRPLDVSGQAMAPVARSEP